MQVDARQFDAVIVGAGPNGLSAAISLAQAGLSVMVVEGADCIGGGSRSAELTLPGFIHDACSAIHPLGRASPFFRSLPLQEHGLEWIFSPAEVAHPLDDGTAVIVKRSLRETGEGLGVDARAYINLLQPLLAGWENLVHEFLGPLHLPSHPVELVRFGLPALFSAETLAALSFRGERARAMFAGMAAHSMLSLEEPITGGFGLFMCLYAHAVGFPMARGGSQKISNALGSIFTSLGGKIVTGHMVRSLNELPHSQVVLFDVTPRQLLHIAGDNLSQRYRRQLQKFRYGPGVFKLDLALDGPIPWKAPETAQAATVHLGGSMEDIVSSEKAVWRGAHPEKPFVLLAQQSLFDLTRAPEGKHSAWAYCHVPNGSQVDMTAQIEAQIERFAPGFKSRILARHTRTAAEMERYNPNYVGGDINGGVQDLFQFFTRPVMRWEPYSTSNKRLFLCSSSTPPGGGVHGMCGYFAAQSVLKHL
jgi:phytoene dehydrogenase-like protein